ncbi:MAG: MarR family transcriptional regulator [Alphaproteobacteria bacterium]|nr:MarR family transcriptional regulator [Alphaproteobacteria bacterium]
MAQSKRGRKAGGSDKKAKRQPSAWPTFLMAHDLLMLRVEERLKAAGLPESNWYVVIWVLKNAPQQRLRMSELADAAVIPRSNLTRLADRMETAGLIERMRVEGDRRGAFACLTAAGKKKEREMWAVYGPAVRDLFGRHLSADEDALLRELMERLLTAARDGRTPG